MIIVIADDFTGAAEITGIGLQYGLSIRLQTDFEITRDTEMVVIDTDSRSGSEDEARAKLASFTDTCVLEKTDILYKKCDSVLRGYVVAELEELLNGFGFDRALLLPVNPSLMRTISEGKYLINGCELQLTEFANDPEYPTTSADILDILGESIVYNIISTSPGAVREEKGLIIGDVTSANELMNWADALDGDTIPVGAADYFAAILDCLKIGSGTSTKTHLEKDDKGNTLYILGSNSAVSRETVARLSDECPTFTPLPCDVTSSELFSKNWLTQWISQVDSAIKEHGYAIATIDQPVHHSDGVSARLAELTALLVERVFEINEIEKLVIEGGATASKVLRQLGLKKFEPIEKLANGVIALRNVETSLSVITKVGSYPWPDGLLPLA